MSLRRSSLAFLSTVALSCSDSSGPGDADLFSSADAVAGGSVTAVATIDGIRVTNLTSAPIAYHALERNTAALALWAPCVSPSPQCLRVAPGTSRTIPRSEIAGFDSRSREVLFWWWHLVQANDGGLRPDSIRTVLVRF